MLADAGNRCAGCNDSLRADATLALINDVNAGDTIAHVSESFQHFIEAQGFASALCATLPRQNMPLDDVILFNSRPVAWTERYLAIEANRNDPVLRELKTRDRPFTWTDIIEQRKLTRKERAVFSLAAEFDMGEGFVVPIREPDGRIGLISLAAPRAHFRSKNGVKVDAGTRSALTVASLWVYHRVTSLKRRPLAGGASLTPREREVLAWIADGKSDWQIGQILKISAKTVNYHVENAKRKLRVATRIQAVIFAMRMDQI